MPFHQDIIELILSKKIQSKDELHKAKIQLCKKYNLRVIPRDSEILANLPADQLENGVAHSLLTEEIEPYFIRCCCDCRHDIS